ncbi:hypothetical protein MLD38_000416 [Melastoma candidum]|uniref:Uncharacterized protein n=1 Tax=Melastoma candidum TaxID=119954 RepID=A0ACB9SBK4_9MYRT|nr:hypothetical protein MLD38_000416 [Melastoma candidum]
MGGALLLAKVVFTSLIVGVLPLTAQGEGRVHHYDFILEETNLTRLCESKMVMTVNNNFPGPVIRAQRGDTVFVNVHNQGDYGVTLHWHGVKQPRNPWSDGPVYITQCLIEPSTNFTYEVNFTEEEGTVWWHAHSDWTRATVHGAIVVLPKEGSNYPFPDPDGEEIIVIASWYQGNLNAELAEDLALAEDLPHSVSFLINGEPGDLVPCSKNTTYRWVVEFGKTYLLRIVNAIVDAEAFFAIAGHNLTVVGMDGSYIKPIHTSYIVISPGQTMDILLTTNQTRGLYYMATREYSSEDAAVTGFDHTNCTAILQYDGVHHSFLSTPLFPDNLPMYLDYRAAMNFTNSIRGLDTPDHPITVPRDVSTKMFITVSMNEILCNDTCSSGHEIVTSLTNISWLDRPLDILEAYYWNITGIFSENFPDFPTTFYNFTGDFFPENIRQTFKGTKVKVLDYNETVEIVFQGTNVLSGSVNHPMHMHGYSFYVIGSGYGNFDNETDPLSYNLDDPPKVNTFPVPKNGWLAIRFVAKNPGVWLWHCHLDRHLSWGMDTVFIVKDGDTEETSMRPPPSYMPPCNVSEWGIPPNNLGGLVGKAGDI